MTFTGIPFAALDFYDDLEADNSKSFWTEHKHIYDESVKAPLEALIAELSPDFGTAKYFRPYRDVRFAKDKTPYKTHQGVYFAESHRYFHVSAAGLFVGGGFYELSADQLARLRRGIADDIAARPLLAGIAAAEKAGLTVSGHQLTRVPTGFDKQHPRAELLKYKSLTLSADLGFEPWLATPRAKSEIVTAWRAMDPVIDWLVSTVGVSDTITGRGRR